MTSIRILLVVVTMASMPIRSWALNSKKDQKVAMMALIAELKTHYGMAKYKEQMFGVRLDDLENKYEQLIEAGRTLEEINGMDPVVQRDLLSPEEFRQLMIGLVSELRDGHVNANRQTTEMATLGMAAVNVGEKLIVTAVRKDLMIGNASMQEIKPGDEILELDDVPVLNLAKRNLLYAQGGTFDDRFSTAMMGIVNNFHSFQRAIPEGKPAVLKLRRDGKEFTAHLRWVYRSDFQMLLSRFPKSFNDPLGGKAFREDVEIPYGVRGTPRSYFKNGLLKTDSGKSLVNIGAQLNAEIEAANKEGSESNGLLKDLKPVTRLHLYMVRHSGRNVGVLRIPDYSPGANPDLKNEYLWTAQGLKKLESLVDVLIIDQLSNTGGAVYFGARLLSLFANGDKPIQTVMTDIKLNSTVIQRMKPGHHKDIVDNTDPVYAEYRLEEKYYNELKQRFEAGEQWSGLGPGFDLQLSQFSERPGEIFPAKEAVFTKPILLLNDHMSGSGGDFFPAQMQYNRRAKIMGETSCGLGGPVYRKTESLPGSELNFRCTYSYAELPDGWPIENIGVVPDIYRPVVIEDLKNGFKSFAAQALDEAVKMVNVGPIHKKTETPSSQKQGPQAISEAAQGLSGLTGEAYLDRLSKLNDLLATQDPAKAELDWNQVVIPLPPELLEDIILKTLWQRLEVRYRLNEMLSLNKWKEQWPMIQVLIKLADGLPGTVRFANPCELRLTMTPLKGG